MDKNERTSSAEKRLRLSEMLVARWMLIIRPAVVTAILGVAMLVLRDEMIDRNPVAIVLIGTYILTLLYWFAHRLTGINRPLLATEIAFDIFIITVIIVYTGGFESPFVGFYFISVMCASLFFRGEITFLFSTQAVVFYFISVFVVSPYLKTSVVEENMKQSIVFQMGLYSLVAYGVGFFSSYYAEKLRGSDKALENALKLLKEAKLDTSDILQSMTNGLLTIDNAGRIIYINTVAESILEVDREKVVGESYGSIFGERAEEFTKFLDKQDRYLFDAAEKEITLSNINGDTIPLGLSAMPLYDTDGSRRGLIINFKDLTEKNKLLEMVRQSDRMAAIGELAAGIAHEIRNPLAAIYNAVEILSDGLEMKDKNTGTLIEIVKKEADRLRRISSDFLQFSRLKAPDIKPIELKKVIAEVLMLVDNDPRKTPDINIFETIEEDTRVIFDIDQMKQLILNVLINSLEALNGNGTIEIFTNKTRYYKGSFTRLTISDNGCGFPEESMGRMFEPFFSTKANGTGLGLALVRKIAVNNGGRIFARNSKNGGAEIVIDMLTYGDKT